MVAHPHIRLIVSEPLSPQDAKLWLSTVNDVLPRGLPAEIEITVKGQPKSSKFYNTKSNGQHCYVIPLSRDPNVGEAQAVTTAWAEAYPEGDFEIDYSSAGAAAAVKKDLEDVGLREIAMEAAKLNHNVWLTEMSDQGWSYAQKFDQRQKRTPMLRPWEQLSNKYRAQELRRFDGLMEVLHRMNLHLVRKPR
jgi:hypothetical protein